MKGFLIFGVTLQFLTSFLLFRTCFSKNVPALFVFGDSLLDPGNNNYIATLSRANYVPNGIDFGWPSGRFTNGRTIVDILGKFIIIAIFLHSFAIFHFSLNKY